MPPSPPHCTRPEPIVKASESNRISASVDVLLSVCVAVYNVKPYLRECFEHLRAQTLQQAEFIVVDDGSTDGSSEICDEYAQSDPRFRVIHHEGNRGTLVARKTGIEAAQGKYTTFLDGDDYYTTPESLSTLVRLQEEYGADVVRFEVRCFGEDWENVQAVQDYLSLKKDISLQTNLEAAQAVHVRGEYGWNLIFRCFCTEVLRKVAAYIPEVHFVCAEDVFIVFLAFFFAKRSVVVKSAPIYAYRIGSGVSTGAVTMAKFPMYAKEVVIARWIEAALKAEGGDRLWFDVLDGMKRRLLSTAAWRLLALLPEDQKVGFDLQVASGFIPDYVQSLAEAHVTVQRQGEVARNLYGAASLKEMKNRPVKTVGVLMPAAEDAAASEEVFRQIVMLRSMGRRVVVFVEPDSACKKTLPEDVERIELPARMEDDRAQTLASAVQRLALDAVLHHRASLATLLWDILVVKLSGAVMVVQLHELPGRRILQQPCVDAVTFESIRPYIYRLADRLLVSNGSVKTYFEAFGGCVSFFPPAPPDVPAVPVVDRQTRSGVLWLGSGQAIRSQGEEVLRLMERISVLSPGVTCRVGCLENDPEAEDCMVKRIHERQQEKTVQWLGPQTNIAALLSQCRVFLMTSVYEAFPQSLATAMLCGAPVVAYEASHFDLLQSKLGCRVVRRGDVAAAAVNAAAILADDALFYRLSAESCAVAEAFYRQNDWGTILSSVLSDDLASEEGKAMNGRLSQGIDLMADVFTQGMRQIEWHEGRRQRKILAVKYAILGKLALTHAKREHYRNKLRKLFA